MSMRRGLLAILAAVVCLTAACGSDDGIQPVYDYNTAFVLVNQELPPGQRDFYLFNLDRRAPKTVDAGALRNGLQQAQARSQSLGIIGPDPERNHRLLQAALPDPAPRKLDRLTLIYVGPAAQRQTIHDLLAPYGAQLRYVVYP